MTTTHTDLIKENILKAAQAKKKKDEEQRQAAEAQSIIDTPGVCGEKPADSTSRADLESAASQPGLFFPEECDTLEETGIPESYAESLVFKHLFAAGNDTGRGVASALCLPNKPIIEILTDLKSQQLVAYKGHASMNDFRYTLTEAGREIAGRCIGECAYNGPAPVPFDKYVESVAIQSVMQETPGQQELRNAFKDLLIDEKMMTRLGPAVNSGRGLFLYGYPGNGKTSIAERITGSFGMSIWIPRAIFCEGETIVLYDAQAHVLVGNDTPSLIGKRHDRRWVNIQRPTIIVGGELQMGSLELRFDAITKITEAPLQMKSNGGTLVIDDFGRQRINPDALLNRWIVPLEKRFDYLTLNNGKKIQVPFDQLIIFSTNLEPKDLVDDAFLRRIPYKINVGDPSEEIFRDLVKMFADTLDMDYCEDSVNHLIVAHYQQAGRSFKACHPRDLMQQIINEARYKGVKPVMSPDAFDNACENYFTLL